VNSSIEPQPGERGEAFIKKVLQDINEENNHDFGLSNLQIESHMSACKGIKWNQNNRTDEGSDYVALSKSGKVKQSKSTYMMEKGGKSTLK